MKKTESSVIKSATKDLCRTWIATLSLAMTGYAAVDETPAYTAALASYVEDKLLGKSELERVIAACEQGATVNPFLHNDAELDTAKWHACETLQEWIATGQVDAPKVCTWAKQTRADRSQERRERDGARQETSLAWDEQAPVLLSMSGEMACAVQGTGELICWDKFREYHAPMGIGSVRSIAVSASLVCAIKEDGFLVCLDATPNAVKCSDVKNQDGRIVCQMNIASELFAKPVGAARALAVGDAHVCWLDSNSVADCVVWREPDYWRPFLGVPPEYQIARAIFLTTEKCAACIILPTGEVGCWSAYGTRTVHELGSPQTITASNAPCAIDADQTLRCLKSGEEFHPPNVIGRVRAISFGDAQIEENHGILGTGATCAILWNEDVVCWSDEGLPLTGFAGPVAAVAVGDNQACAQLKNSTVSCWTISSVNTSIFVPPHNLKMK